MRTSAAEAESPWCSFHASYQKLPGGGLKACWGKGLLLQRGPGGQDFVADRWSLSAQPRGMRTARQIPARGAENNFTVSGMAFMDADSLDLDRLRRCHICGRTPSAAWCRSAPTTLRQATEGRSGNETYKTRALDMRGRGIPRLDQETLECIRCAV